MGGYSAWLLITQWNGSEKKEIEGGGISVLYSATLGFTFYLLSLDVTPNPLSNNGLSAFSSSFSASMRSPLIQVSRCPEEATCRVRGRDQKSPNPS